MAKPYFADAFIKALIGIFAVYLAIVIARAGYEVGRIFAGKSTLAEAAANFDVSGAGVASAILVLLIHAQRQR